VLQGIARIEPIPAPPKYPKNSPKKTVFTPFQHPKSPNLMSRIDEFPPKRIAHEYGVSKEVVLSAIRDGKLKCTRVNARNFKILSEDAARWWRSLSNSPQLPTTENRHME
jgi:hypothetical protein